MAATSLKSWPLTSSVVRGNITRQERWWRIRIMIACSRQTVYGLESWSCQSCQSWSCVLLVVHIVLLLIVCVCGDHLNRCKTSFRWFWCTTCLVWLFMIFFLFQFSRRGMECASDVSIQRRRICCTVIWIGDAQSTYLLNLFHFRPWQPTG